MDPAQIAWLALFLENRQRPGAGVTIGNVRNKVGSEFAGDPAQRRPLAAVLDSAAAI